MNLISRLYEMEIEKEKKKPTHFKNWLDLKYNCKNIGYVWIKINRSTNNSRCWMWTCNTTEIGKFSVKKEKNS